MHPQSVQQIDEAPTPIIPQNQTEMVAEQQDAVVIDITNETPVEIIELEKPGAEQQALKCPKCSGDLILRTATRGANTGKQFYGCSNYPKCKYISKNKCFTKRKKHPRIDRG